MRDRAVLRSADGAGPSVERAVPPALPAPLTSFIGRQSELAEVERLLGTTRLLTLTGAGGIGKTRLALEVASRMAPAFRDGIWWVDLASLAEPALVPTAVAEVLRVAEAPDRPLETSLADALRSRALLLVLDNCEHLAAACAALVAGLLRACPLLEVLATSRQSLGLTGEVAWRVPGLAVPARAPDCSEAVQLFVERAAAASRSFALTERNGPAIAEICRRLDGIPLAIELAAARVTVLSADEIAARLTDRFRLLSTASQAALPRHRTLRALIDWSYDLLSGPEQTLLARLSVFAGGWTLDAAEAVCGSRVASLSSREVSPEIFDVFARLIDKSLVVAEERAGAMRYCFLDTIRTYAAQRLRESGQEDVIRGRHLEWYLALAETAARELRTADDERWLARLETEHDNLRAALSWSEQHATAAPDAWPRLTAALWWFWHLHGHAEEGLRRVERALAAAGAATPAVRAELLNGAGFLRYDRGDYEQAVPLLEEAGALSRQIGSRRIAVFALTTLGFALHYRGESARGQATIEAGLSLARQAADGFGVVRALNALGALAHGLGEPERARRLLEESVALSRGLQSRGNLALALLLLGRAMHALGDTERGAALLDEALALARDIGYTRAEAWSLQFLGGIARSRGDLQAARTLYQRSLALWVHLGARRSSAMCLEQLAAVLAAARLADTAVQLLAAADAAREALGAPPTLAERLALDQTSAALRSALGAEAYATAWGAGQRLSLDAAARLAVGDQDAIVDVTKATLGRVRAGSAAPLTRREREVAALVARGLTNREIAAALVISEGTAGVHVKHILHKLGFRTRAQVAAWVVGGVEVGEPALESTRSP